MERVRQGLFDAHVHEGANQLIQAVRAEYYLSVPTVSKAIARLEQLGIAKEITGKQRGKMFAYDKYLEILTEGTDPL